MVKSQDFYHSLLSAGMNNPNVSQNQPLNGNSIFTGLNGPINKNSSTVTPEILT